MKHKTCTSLKKLSFTASFANNCLFVKMTQEGLIFLLIFVDDILIIAKTDKVADRFKQELSKIFEVDDLGQASMYLGIKINKNQNGDVVLSQMKYVKEVLACFDMGKCFSSTMPMITN